MNLFTKFRPFIAAPIVCVLISGCYSQKEVDAHAEMRRQKLLEMYPVGKTTQQDVAARWKYPPQLSDSRPAGGWNVYPEFGVKTYATKAEARIGKKISKVERYYGADGFLSLCYCWYYYNSSGRLLDAEWQWSSD